MNIITKREHKNVKIVYRIAAAHLQVSIDMPLVTVSLLRFPPFSYNFFRHRHGEQGVIISAVVTDSLRCGHQAVIPPPRPG